MDPAVEQLPTNDERWEDPEEAEELEEELELDEQQARPQREERESSSRSLAWLAAAVAAATLAAIAVAVALVSIFVELLLPPEAEVYFLTQEPPRQPNGVVPYQAGATYLNMAIVEIDEGHALATIRVSGHRTCRAACEPLDLTLFSLSGAQAKRIGLPPSAQVHVESEAREITTSVQLPVSGQPSLYPFDRYELLLGAKAEGPVSDQANGATRAAGPPGPLYLTVQSQLNRMNMMGARQIEPSSLHADTDPYVLPFAIDLRFRRPIYLGVLAVLLVLFVSGAAGYAVRTRPVPELVLGVGSLVLGTWGIRSILVPGGPPYVTAVDLALSCTILMMLAAILTRAFLHVRRDRSSPGPT